jgi:hypothetical protein
MPIWLDPDSGPDSESDPHQQHFLKVCAFLVYEVIFLYSPQDDFFRLTVRYNEDRKDKFLLSIHFSTGKIYSKED